MILSVGSLRYLSEFYSLVKSNCWQWENRGLFIDFLDSNNV